MGSGVALVQLLFRSGADAVSELMLDLALILYDFSNTFPRIPAKSLILYEISNTFHHFALNSA